MRVKSIFAHSKEPKAAITIKIPETDKIALEKEAKKRKTTVASLVRKTIQETIINQKKTVEWPKPRALGIKEFSRKDLYE